MLLYELVENTQSVRFTFGRFNPPHVGHKKLLNAVAKGGGKYYIFPSHTHNNKKLIPCTNDTCSVWELG